MPPVNPRKEYLMVYVKGDLTGFPVNYTFNYGFNKIMWSESNTYESNKYYAEIPVGSYTGEELAKTIADLMTIESKRGYAYQYNGTWDNETRELKITSTSTGCVFVIRTNIMDWTTYTKRGKNLNCFALI
jgi:hypothetical protein